MSVADQKIITCRALAGFVEPLAAPGAVAKVMEIGLHLQPERLRQSLNQAIAEVEAPGRTIILGYGLCGRALEGVVSQKSTLVLPRTDDCVGTLLGSRQRHREVLRNRPGSYFLEPSWLDTELNIFAQMVKDMRAYPPEKAKRLIQAALRHYDTLVLLADKSVGSRVRERCQALADEFDLELMRMAPEIGLIKKLLHGPHTEDEFVIAQPGCPIPLF